MDMEYMTQIGITMVGDLTLMVTMYVIFRRGIAIRMSAIIALCISIVALLSFFIGKEGAASARGAIVTLIGVPLVVVLLVLLVKEIIIPTRQVAALVADIAEGNFERHITITGKDEFGEMAHALQNMKSRIGAVLQETERQILAVQEGRLTARADAKAFRGSWRDLVVGVNTMIDAFSAPIAMMTTAIEHISNGNIPARITEEYNGDFNEVKKNLNTMIKTLSSFTLSIQAASEQVATSSQLMSSSASQMAQGANEQAAATEEASASMEEMSANIRQTSDNALFTEKIAVKSATDAHKGRKAVAHAVAAMKDIAQKIAIVEEIARKTHMLSLNATIEAAKAREHGKGFAVVASEVRTLANHSQQAAEEINSLTISSLTIVQKAGKRLRALVPNSQKTSELVQEISAASSEQNSGAEQINRAIQQLEQVTQQNAATSEELATTAEELASQAKQLQSVAAFFKVAEIEKEHLQPAQMHSRDMYTQNTGTDREDEQHKHTVAPASAPVEKANLNREADDEWDHEFERY